MSSYIITEEYMAQKRKIRMEHRDVSHLESIKSRLDSLGGWIEEILDDEDSHYQGWSKQDLEDFIETLNELRKRADKEAEELYKQYGLVYVTEEMWKEKMKNEHLSGNQ